MQEPKLQQEAVAHILEKAAGHAYNGEWAACNFQCLLAADLTEGYDLDREAKETAAQRQIKAA